MKSEAIVDAGCFIALEKIDKQSLPGRLFSVVVMPQAVALEVGHSPKEVQVLADPEGHSAAAIPANLGRGERACIALALQRPAATLLMDDLRARKAARHLGCEVMGTLGILLEAKKRGHVAAIAPAIDQLLSAGIYLSPQLIVHALNLAGESAEQKDSEP